MIQHIVTVDDLSIGFIDRILERAQFWRNRRGMEFSSMARAWPLKVLITDFYEPSTRTRLSFEAAMCYLGGRVIGTENAAEFSSAKKGESIADNFRVISGYCDVIVGRFRNEGEARIAADASLVPLINGGDGAGEHPTQALIDYFTMWDHFHAADTPLRVTFIGDNRRSRTVRSLVRLLTKFNKIEVAAINFISPYNLCPDEELRELPITAGMSSSNAYFRSQSILQHSDVVYVTRSQNERSDDHIQYDSPYTLTPDSVDLMPANGIVMHPLPRNAELPVEIDANPRARYFEQAHNGLYVRMALLEELLRP